jgi:integrase
MIGPHCLRHTFASLYLTEAASADVYYLSRMLGHATIGETVDTYGRWLPANRKGALDVLDDALLATNSLLTEQLAVQVAEITSGQGRS